MHQAAGWQIDRKSRTGDRTDSLQTDRSRGGQIDSKGRQMMLHAATISDTYKMFWASFISFLVK